MILVRCPITHAVSLPLMSRAEVSDVLALARYTALAAAYDAAARAGNLARKAASHIARADCPRLVDCAALAAIRAIEPAQRARDAHRAAERREQVWTDGGGRTLEGRN